MQGKSSYSPRPGGTTVVVRNDDVNGAMRRLRRVLDKDNRQKDLARHEYYEKPSTKRSRAKKLAVSRQNKVRQEQIQSGAVNVGRSMTDLSYMKSKRKRRVIIDQQNYRPRQNEESDQS